MRERECIVCTYESFSACVFVYKMKRKCVCTRMYITYAEVLHTYICKIKMNKIRTPTLHTPTLHTLTLHTPTLHTPTQSTAHTHTSSTLRELMRSSTSDRVFFLTSRSGLVNTLRISITRSCNTLSCVGESLRVMRRSRTMSLTLLSLSLTMRSM